PPDNGMRRSVPALRVHSASCAPAVATCQRWRRFFRVSRTRVVETMRIDVVTLFPEFVRQCAGFGVIGRAVERGLLEVEAWNPRDHAEGGYRRVDDSVCGGGPGMVMLIEPLRKALAAARQAAGGKAPVIYLSP